MKWILSVAVLCVSSTVFADARQHGLPLASDRHRHKKHQEETLDCCNYSWVACSDPNQVALFVDGNQIGNYRDGKYYPLQGDSWGKACSIPSGCSLPPAFSSSNSFSSPQSSWEGDAVRFRSGRIFRGGFIRGGGCSGGG